MQHLEVSGAVRHIYIYIYVIRWLKDKRHDAVKYDVAVVRVQDGVQETSLRVETDIS